MVSQLTKAESAPVEEPIRIAEPTRPGVPKPGAIAPNWIGVHIGTDGSHSMTANHEVQRKGVRMSKHGLMTSPATKDLPIFMCETVMSGPPESTGFLPIAQFEPSKGEWG